MRPSHFAAGLPLAATHELCGADRIVWASDFPHPDAKYPGVTEELLEATESLDDDARRLIAGQNALRLYGLASARAVMEARAEA